MAVGAMSCTRLGQWSLAPDRRAAGICPGCRAPTAWKPIGEVCTWSDGHRLRVADVRQVDAARRGALRGLTDMLLFARKWAAVQESRIAVSRSTSGTGVSAPLCGASPSSANCPIGAASAPRQRRAWPCSRHRGSYNPTRRHSALGYLLPIEYAATARAEND